MTSKREYTPHMREMNRLYRERNLDAIKVKQKKYSKDNREKISKKHKEFYQKNKEYFLNRQKKYYQEHKKQILLYLAKYQKEKLKNDANYRLARILRTRLYHALKGNSKTGSSVTDLGCTVKELKQYLEKKFHPGMSWDRPWEFHIDHIKALSKFDLTDRKQLLEACNYKNLQPLWVFDNLSKGAK